MFLALALCVWRLLWKRRTQNFIFVAFLEWLNVCHKAAMCERSTGGDLDLRAWRLKHIFMTLKLWIRMKIWNDGHFQSVTRQYYIYRCAPTSWHLAAPGCSYVWLTFFWKSGEHIIHRVKSFPGDMNQCVTVLWNGDLPCCCVSKSAFFWRYDAGVESYLECLRANRVQDGRRISLVEMCIVLLLHWTLSHVRFWSLQQILLSFESFYLNARPNMVFKTSDVELSPMKYV